MTTQTNPNKHIIISTNQLQFIKNALVHYQKTTGITQMDEWDMEIGETLVDMITTTITDEDGDQIIHGFVI